LPQTFEEFLDLFYRAFVPPREVRELFHDQLMLRQVAQTVWDRLHLYERQVQQENARLDAALQKDTQPVESFKELRARTYAVQAAFQIEPWLTTALVELDTYLDQDVRRLVKWRYGPPVYREVCPPPPNATTRQ